ncbi:MAG: hypothetical protein JNM90_06505 [Burkholderiales bacterium]|nr:hypothetical protein [Burkholderiales bacterium]
MEHTGRVAMVTEAERIARLEARVAALERALARVSAILANRAPPASRPAAAGVVATAPAAPSAPVPPAAAQRGAAVAFTVPEAPAGARTAPALAAGPDSRSTLDRLGITAAFAMLDQNVAEAAQRESALARSAPVRLDEITIDESLIDKAFARPPPQKLDVKSDLEALHPRIVERLTGTWRTPELLAYMRKLIVDERGDRAGFSPSVMSELLMLSAVLEAPADADAWDANARAV